MGKPDKTSPLKDRPLHNPGHSLETQLADLRHDKILAPLLVVLLVMLTATEWVRWHTGAPPNPLVYTLIAIAYAIYAAVTIRRNRKRLTAIKLGLDGERAVGQYLELLRESGARIFHDIVGKGFNLDHVVLTTQGIFVVETKTWSKPAHREAHITFDLLVPDVRIERTTYRLQGGCSTPELIRRKPDRGGRAHPRAADRAAIL